MCISISYSCTNPCTVYAESIKKYMHIDDWYVWVNMNSGKQSWPMFQSLDAYWPGVEVIITHSLTHSLTHEDIILKHC